VCNLTYFCDLFKKIHAINEKIKIANFLYYNYIINLSWGYYAIPAFYCNRHTCPGTRDGKWMYRSLDGRSES
jgi:hypothetical protein